MGKEVPHAFSHQHLPKGSPQPLRQHQTQTDRSTIRPADVPAQGSLAHALYTEIRTGRDCCLAQEHKGGSAAPKSCYRHGDGLGRVCEGCHSGYSTVGSCTPRDGCSVMVACRSFTCWPYSMEPCSEAGITCAGSKHRDWNHVCWDPCTGARTGCAETHALGLEQGVLDSQGQLHAQEQVQDLGDALHVGLCMLAPKCKAELSQDALPSRDEGIAQQCSRAHGDMLSWGQRCQQGPLQDTHLLLSRASSSPAWYRSFLVTRLKRNSLRLQKVTAGKVSLVAATSSSLVT